MAGLFSRSNSTDEDRAAAIAISAPMRLTLGKLTPAQRLEACLSGSHTPVNR